MARVSASTDVISLLDELNEENSVSTLKNFARFVQLVIADITQQVNGAIDVQENLRVSIKSIAFSASATDQAVSHGLGRVPAGYIVSGRSVNLTIYDGGGLTDTNNISLRSSAVGTAKLLFF